jgi:hypothetical protein
MAQTNASAATAILRIAAVVGILYGLGFLLLPTMLFGFSQDPGIPADPGWVRWAGGFIIGVAVAAWLASDHPETQRPIIVGLAIGYTLTALALLYSTFSGEYSGTTWWIWLGIVVTAALAAGMWWSSTKAA